jgi:Lysyl oxidase
MPRVLLILAGLLIAAAAIARPALAYDLPDLEQVAPYDVRVVQGGDQFFLGFATSVRNVGMGVLRLRGTGPGDGTMRAQQLTPDGFAVLAPDAGVLRYVTTPGHSHWHYMDFMKYELHGIDKPGILSDHKQGFCLAALSQNWCGRNQPALPTIDLGIESNGIDTYVPYVEGQEIQIDPQTTPSGRYLLTSRIGPTGVLQETRTDNNVATTVIELRWPLSNQQPIPAIASCVGEGCAGATPLPGPLRRLTAAEAHRLARRALRRTFRRLGSDLRMACRPLGAIGRACRVTWQRGHWRYRGTIRLRHERVGAATRWYYRLNIAGRVTGCRRARCVRRIRRPERLGGTLTTHGTAARSAGSRWQARALPSAHGQPRLSCALPTSRAATS